MFNVRAPGGIAFFFLMLQSFNAGAAVTEAPRVGPLEAYEQLKAQTALIIDVREKNELTETGMVAGALWMPTSKIGEDSAEWKQFEAGLAKEKLMIVYCRSGTRAGKVATRLLGDGLRAANMGGFDAWKKAGFPVVYPATLGDRLRP